MIIKIGYDDFRKLANESNKRIYYYQMDDILELAYIVEGVIIKTLLDLTTIPDKEVFFGDKLFVNAVKLMFRIPDESEAKLLARLEPNMLSTLTPVETEMQEKDLQKEGVDE